MAWTEDQKRAIYESGHNILDSAGAGSGKTAVLSERVRYFVSEKGYKLSEFLILTFTNLAAGEMKDRIRKKLEEISSPEAAYVDSSDISSIDSFFNSIVKKYHYLIGVSKDMGVIDDGVMTVTKYKILDEMFEREYEQNNSIFEKLISEFCFKDDNELRKLIISIQEGIDLEIDKDKYYDEYDKTHYSEEFYNELINEEVKEIVYLREKLINAVYDLPNIPTKKGGPDLAEIIKGEFKDFFESETYDELILNYNKVTELPKKPRNMDEEYGDIWNEFSETNKEIKGLISEIPQSKKDFILQIENNREYANYLMSLARELDIKQYEYKVQNQVFSFQDIAKMALNLVKTNESVREEIKSKYKMIMVDEYQDTSDIQEEMISCISNHNAYMVGDIKQSIYAFRNAKCEIFAGKYSRYKMHDDGEVIDMNKNFRSRREVLSDINDFFSHIMTLETGGADYKKDHMIEYGLLDYLKGDNENQNNHSEFITYDLDAYKEEGINKNEVEARLIAEDIISKINSKYTVFKPGNDKKGIEATRRNCEFKDFCILMEAGTEFDTYKKIFTEYQIPLFVEKDEDIKNNMIVKLLKNILYIVKAIKTNTFDSNATLAFLSLSRSFIFDINDEEIFKTCKNNDFFNSKVYQDIKEIVTKNEGLSNAELLDEIIYKLDVYHKLVLIGDCEINSLYLDEFRKKFKAMSTLDYELDDFIVYLDKVDELGLKLTLPTKGSTLNSVKIMNIHKSKGLEFPIVYFPYLTHGFNDALSRMNFIFSSKYGVILPVKDEKSILKRIRINKDKKDTLSEKIRLLYVALTRTREKMIFVLPHEQKIVEKEDARSFDNLMRPFINKYPHRDEKIKGSEEIKLLISESNKVHKKLSIEKLDFTYNVKDMRHASKALVLGSNKIGLEYGTYLHEAMEVFDFVNPDYSIIKNEKTKEIIKRFLDSDIMKNVKNAKVYHEYPFVNDDTKGIIDLFLLYEDHIDLIDYKTSNIDDTHYEEQLNVYRDFLMKKFDKKVDSYLYSLNTGTYRKI